MNPTTISGETSIRATLPGEEPRLSTAPSAAPAPRTRPVRKPKSLAIRVLEVAGSLRITVVCFGLAMLLVLFGTFAQVGSANFVVVKEYFRAAYVFMPIQVLTAFKLPAAWSINHVTIPFPGGWLIGGVLLANMLCAFLLRAIRIVQSPRDQATAFLKRTGVYLLHLGIILMMAGELVAGKFGQEGLMVISEGQAVNYIQRVDALELAITDVTDPKRTHDDIVAIYEPALRRGDVSDEKLPFDISVEALMPNSIVRARKEGDPAQADAGEGKDLFAVQKPVVRGTSQEKERDVRSIVVTLTRKDSKEKETRLVSMWLEPETITVGDRKYQIVLRDRRDYRDFFVRLDKGEEVDHPNTMMAQDYSSWVQLISPDTDEDRPVHIFMNAPMRYRGETFYQSGMNPNGDGTFTTVLQVVRNPGWILPYVSCIVVALGMLIHFGMNLIGFLSRRVNA